MKALHLGILFVTSLGLAACNKPAEPVSSAPIDATAPADAATAAAAAPAAPAAVPVDTLSKNLVADAIPFQPEVGKVDGNAVASTGAAGFLMFGPYVPFVAGNYHVTVQGSIASLKPGSAVAFDVATDAGATVLGKQDVGTAHPENGAIAEFDVTVPEGVANLEVRAGVPEGVDMRIESYTVTKSN